MLAAGPRTGVGDGPQATRSAARSAGSAAEEAGIRIGWVAIARNGEPLTEEGITFTSERGVSYEWTFVDENNALRQVKLLARTLPDRMPPQERHSDEGWVYLRFDEFETDHQHWLAGIGPARGVQQGLDPGVRGQHFVRVLRVAVVLLGERPTLPATGAIR